MMLTAPTHGVLATDTYATNHKEERVSVLFYTSDLIKCLFSMQEKSMPEDAAADIQGREDSSVSPHSGICVIKVLPHMSVIFSFF